VRVAELPAGGDLAQEVYQKPMQLLADHDVTHEGCDEKSARALLPLYGVLAILIENQIFTVACSKGYNLTNSNHGKFECSKDIWVSSGTPVCKSFSCASLSPVVHGEVEFADTRHGSQASYECHPGYHMLGKNTRTCLDTGYWTGQEPTCKQDEDLDPTIKKSTSHTTPMVPIEVVLAVALTLLYLICRKRRIFKFRSKII